MSSRILYSNRPFFRIPVQRGSIVQRAMSQQPVPNPEEYSKRWEIMWQGGNDQYEVKNGDGGILKPGQSFDAGKSPPHLTECLAQNKLGDISNASVLIPGCGRGYDVISFARYAKRVTGLELAPTAVAAAHDKLREDLPEDLLAKADVVSGDFFGPSEQQYDIGYDYTFFCAISPAMRDGWASSWAARIRDDGLLVTSIFPVFEDRSQQGPPWPVWPELYAEKLEQHGFSLQSLEKVPDEGSHPGREGKEYLAVWKKNATKH